MNVSLTNHSFIYKTYANIQTKTQSFALLGDLAKNCFVHLRSHLDDIVPIACRNLTQDLQHSSVCNNASWALGEIAMKHGAAMEPYAPHILAQLTTIINKLR